MHTSIHILAAVAEHEREAISERTKAALAAAKARGKKLGGPRLDEARRRSIAARSEIADAFAANVRPIIKEIQASGVSSMRGIARALTARDIPTARGGDWSDVQVHLLGRRRPDSVMASRKGTGCHPFSGNYVALLHQSSAKRRLQITTGIDRAPRATQPDFATWTVSGDRSLRPRIRVWSRTRAPSS